ncbi:MAG: class I SAM-dependent RNA methyltransferase [Myxococcales bacterium]|nr:class I SAM-dependent RNA methyltransferase [Myxococcales bacterium]MCB9609425.1 class I SAM-dependent RNA methyltransferase [Polyangiaceae bacterium]
MTRLEGGGVGFARGVVPGDIILAENIKRHSGYQRAEQWTLVEPGMARVQPICPVQQRCGGCDWMHLELAAQREAKKEILREALLRTGGFRAEALPEIRLESAGADTGYRRRAQLQVDARGRLGFFSSGTHELVEVERCLVCNPRLEEMLGVLRGIASQGHFRGFTRLELRIADHAPERLVRATLKKQRGKRGASGNASLEARMQGEGIRFVVAGSAADKELLQRWDVSEGVEIAAPPAAFTQVNAAVNRALVAAVVRGAEQRGVRRFLDLYCGAGNFSFPLAAAGLSGVGIEISEPAVLAARANMSAVAERLGRPLDVRFFAGDAEQVLAEMADGRFDLIVLDPPRAGAKESVPFVVSSAARWLCMCSCDPVTLARDLKALGQAGFVIEEISAYDMFPHTHHVEALVWLRRNSG